MPDEYLTIVKKTDAGLEVQGCVASRFAHSDARIPHTSVQLIPVFRGTHDVLIHRRPEHFRMYPNKQDFNGGHVTFELGLLTGQNALAEVIDYTALREAQEEIWAVANGQPHIITPADIHRITRLGQLTADQPMNVEHSTAFVVFLPASADPTDHTVKVMDGGTLMACQRLPLHQVRAEFRNNPDDFADGASRILSQLDANREFEQGLMAVMT